MLPKWSKPIRQTDRQTHTHTTMLPSRLKIFGGSWRYIAGLKPVFCPKLGIYCEPGEIDRLILREVRFHRSENSSLLDFPIFLYIRVLFKKNKHDNSNGNDNNALLIFPRISCQFYTYETFFFLSVSRLCLSFL